MQEVWDINRFVQQLREWSAAHPHNGPVIRNAGELRQLIAEKERQHAEQAALTLNDALPKPEKS